MGYRSVRPTGKRETRVTELAPIVIGHCLGQASDEATRLDMVKWFRRGLDGKLRVTQEYEEVVVEEETAATTLETRSWRAVGDAVYEQI